MSRKRGFVSVSILITMLLILVIATMGVTSTSGVRKTFVSSSMIKENYLLGENITSMYQMFLAEKIKKIYLETPNDPIVTDYLNDLDKMNEIMLSRCFNALTDKWYYEFKEAMISGNMKNYLNFEFKSLGVSKEYYNPRTKKYVEHRLNVTNSDFRAVIKINLVGDKGEKQLDTYVYFYIPIYTSQQQKQWIEGEPITIIDEEFEDSNLVRVGDTVVFG